MSDDAELAALYRHDLRDWAAQVRNDRRLVPADASITRTSRTCGSSVTLDIRRHEDRILELGWRVRACTLGMAATAVVVRHAPGRRFDDVAGVAAMVGDLLNGEDVVFPDGWRDLAAFQAARNFPARHNSIMLAFAALSAGAP